MKHLFLLHIFLGIAMSLCSQDKEIILRSGVHLKSNTVIFDQEKQMLWYRIESKSERVGVPIKKVKYYLFQEDILYESRHDYYWWTPERSSKGRKVGFFLGGSVGFLGGLLLFYRNVLAPNSHYQIYKANRWEGADIYQSPDALTREERYQKANRRNLIGKGMMSAGLTSLGIALLHHKPNLLDGNIEREYATQFSPTLQLSPAYCIYGPGLKLALIF